MENGVYIDNLTKTFGSLVAVDSVSLHVQEGEFFALLGPSGCGKTTLLRIVAGFEQPDSGRLFIDQVEMKNVPPQSRPTAMVFQNYALFPNMTVGENVAYGLRVRRVERSDREQRVREALDRVSLYPQINQPVTLLSGGQQQRVALARALAVRPKVLLFDEPLSNLDVALREQTRRELKILQHDLGTTSIYVTHDQQEALALSDRIAVIRNGQVQQVGSPEMLYKEPQTSFVAGFLGGSNIIRDIKLSTLLTGVDTPPSGHVLSIRPEDLKPSSTNGIPVKVKSRQFLGIFTEWWLEIDGVTLRAWLEPNFEGQDQIHLSVQKYRWVREG